MQRLRIVSIADTTYVAQAYLETVKSAEALGFAVSHLGVANDLWYSGGAEAAYAAGHCQVLLSPRPSGNSTPWWHAADIRSEAAAALPAIARFYQRIIREFRPHVCLIADDQGTLEVFTIRTMNDNHVPVLLLEHGFGFAFARRLPHLAQARAGARRLRAAAASRWRARRAVMQEDRQLCQLPEVRPFGRNGVCTICAYSGFTAKELVRRGVPRRAIRHTGFPYYDQVVRLRDQSPPCLPGKSLGRERLLLLSSGNTRFGWSEHAVQAWQRNLEIAQIAAASYDVTVRLHPGETLESLPEDIRSKLLASSACIDIAEEPVRFVLPGYSLVVGEVSSVHQEASILGVASVVVASSSPPTRTPQLSLFDLLEGRLSMLVLRQGDDITATLAAAGRLEYRQALADAMLETGRLVYDNDGLAGRRVAETILLQCGLEKRTATPT